MAPWGFQPLVQLGLVEINHLKFKLVEQVDWTGPDEDLVEEDATDREPLWALLPPKGSMCVDSIQHRLGLANIDDNPLMHKCIHPTPQAFANRCESLDFQDKFHLSPTSIGTLCRFVKCQNEVLYGPFKNAHKYNKDLCSHALGQNFGPTPVGAGPVVFMSLW